MDHSRVKDRERLKPLPKGEPYWQRLRPGCYLGFAPSTKSGEGTWHVRAYDPEKRGYRRKSLGAFADVSGSGKFAAAKIEAERFTDVIETGGHREAKLQTVADACRIYAGDRPEAEQRFKRYVYDDPVAKVRLDRLRRRHLREWRERLEKTPAQVSRSKQGQKRSRERAPSTINRDMVVLRAALAKVLSPGPPSSEAAWQEALKPIRNADGRRTLYLDKGQRRALLKNVEAEAAPAAAPSRGFGSADRRRLRPKNQGANYWSGQEWQASTRQAARVCRGASRSSSKGQASHRTIVHAGKWCALEPE